MIHSVSFGNITKPYPGFYTNPESYILENSSQQQTKHMPVTQSQQKTSTSKHKTRQNSDNTVKWLFGAIALAGLATLGILGHKGYLGEDIQKLLGGLKKAESAPKNTKSGGEKLGDNLDDAVEKPVAEETGEPVIPPSGKENLGEVSEEASKNPVVEKEELVPSGENTSTGLEPLKPEQNPKVVHTDETPKIKIDTVPPEFQADIERIVQMQKEFDKYPSTYEEIVPEPMRRYIELSDEELAKFKDRDSCGYIIFEKYPSGKPKYIKYLPQWVHELDEETGYVIKEISKDGFYNEYSPEVSERKLVNVFFDSENKKLVDSIELYKYDSKTNKCIEEVRRSNKSCGDRYCISFYRHMPDGRNEECYMWYLADNTPDFFTNDNKFVKFNTDGSVSRVWVWEKSE